LGWGVESAYLQDTSAVGEHTGARVALDFLNLSPGQQAAFKRILKSVNFEL